MKNVYAEIADQILVTYNDIKCDRNGEHIALYFEKPIDGGFAFLETSLPDLNVIDTSGFTPNQVTDLMSFAKDNSPLIWEMAREGSAPIAHAV